MSISGETILLVIAFIGMVAGVLLTFIPITPGALLVWGIALVAGILDGFNRITVPALIVISALMLINVSSDYWLPFLGVKTSGTSCLSGFGAIMGGLVGTFAIPIPILGTFVGTILGALLVEFIVAREQNRAMRAGMAAAKMFVVGYILELVTVFVMLIIFMISVATTA
jgi:hypothetical protein